MAISPKATRPSGEARWPPPVTLPLDGVVTLIVRAAEELTLDDVARFEERLLQRCVPYSDRSVAGVGPELGVPPSDARLIERIRLAA